MPFINTAIKAINKGVQIHKNIKAGKAAQAKKPAPRPVAKKPVAVIPAPVNPPKKPATVPSSTYNVFGARIPKQIAHGIGGIALGSLLLGVALRR